MKLSSRFRLFYYRDSYRDYRERFRIIEITEIIEYYRDFSETVGYGIRLASQKLSKIIEILFKIIEIIEIFGDIHYRRLSKWNLDNRKVCLEWHEVQFRREQTISIDFRTMQIFIFLVL